MKRKRIESDISLNCDRGDGTCYEVTSIFKVVETGGSVIDHDLFEKLDRQSHGLMTKALTVAALKDDRLRLFGAPIQRTLELLDYLGPWTGDVVKHSVSTVAALFDHNSVDIDDIKVLEEFIPAYVIRDLRWVIEAGENRVKVTADGSLGKDGPYCKISFYPHEASPYLALPLEVLVERWADMDDPASHSIYCQDHYYSDPDMTEETAIEWAAAECGIDPEDYDTDCQCEAELIASFRGLIDVCRPDPESIRDWIETSLWAEGIDSSDPEPIPDLKEREDASDQ